MRTRFRPSLAGLAAALGLALLAGPAAARVIVVDAAGGGEFVSLQTAVVQASDGDVLLIQPGNYSGTFQFLFIDGKAISLVADGDPVIAPPIYVQSTPAGATTLLRGLTVNTEPGTALDVALEVAFCNGAVVVEDCDLTGRAGNSLLFISPGFPALSVHDSAVVIVRGSSLTGGDSGADNGTGGGLVARGGAGAEVLSGDVSFYDSLLVGGHGGDYTGTLAPGLGGPGGYGLTAQDACVLVAGTTVQGGDSGDGDDTSAGAGTAGGTAVQAGATARVRGYVSPLMGGAGGLDGNRLQGPDGDQFAGKGGLLIVSGATPRALALGSPVREGQTLSLVYRGETGDVLFLFLGLSTDALPLPFKGGTFQLASPFVGPIVFPAVTDPSGLLTLEVVAPRLDPGLEAIDTYWQALVVEEIGVVRLSSLSSLTIVDDSF